MDNMACGHCSQPLENYDHHCFAGSINVYVDENNIAWGTKMNIKEEKDEINKNPPSVPSPTAVAVTPASTSTDADAISNSNKWSDAEVQLLIASYVMHENMFSLPQYSSKMVWDIISQEIKKFNVFKKPDKCHEKWRNLKGTYKKILETNEKTGIIKSNWPFFESMHEIFYKNPSMKPIATCSSTNLCNSGAKLIKVKEDSKKRKTYDKLEIILKLEEQREKRHKEKMELKREMFYWFKENFGKKD